MADEQASPKPPPGSGPKAAPMRSRRSDLLKLAAAAGLIAALLAGTLLLVPHAPSQGYAGFEAVFAGLTYGLGQAAGLWAVGVSAALVAYLVLRGEGFAVADPTDALGLLAFIGAGLCIVMIVGRLRAGLAAAEERRAGIEADCADKIALLSELSHRVRNDLGSLMSLALLQKSAAQSEEAREALGGMANRIQVFGDVYRRLNADAAHQSVDMRAFLTGLCNDLREAHLSMLPIALKVRAERYDLPVGQAALVGLVLNEALTNALKYAFPDNRSGTIRVAFGRDPGTPGALVLTVTDDGIGLSGGTPNGTGMKGTGMGQRLMRAMASQLGGAYALERVGASTVARLSFSEG